MRVTVVYSIFRPTLYRFFFRFFSSADLSFSPSSPPTDALLPDLRCREIDWPSRSPEWWWNTRLTTVFHRCCWSRWPAFTKFCRFRTPVVTITNGPVRAEWVVISSSSSSVVTITVVTTTVVVMVATTTTTLGKAADRSGNSQAATMGKAPRHTTHTCSMNRTAMVTITPCPELPCTTWCTKSVSIPHRLYNEM